MTIGVGAKINHTERYLIIIAVMAATLMQALDTTIVNVALPHMQGSLNASPDQITWTLTSYLVASAIFMPLTGYFSDRLGRKTYLLICIGGFTLASALCGISMSLLEIVLFRLLQGIFGAALIPLSQAILTDIYSAEERGKAMAIWGTGVMVGPILGPTLGGYLTEIANWRWTFYVNVPVGIFAVLLAWQYIPETQRQERRLDWKGLFLLSIAIGCLQYFLDRGNHQDWFESRDIQFTAFLSAISFISFIFYSSQQKKHPIFDVHIFKDRNFTIASLLLLFFGLGLFGVMVIQPLMMEDLLRYPVLTTGILMAPRGISGMVSMMIVGRIINKVDPRILIASGIFLSAGGIAIGTWYSTDINPAWIAWPLVLQGLGLGAIFVTLSSIAFATLPSSSRVEAAGLYSLLRTIGSSIGISISITFFTRHAQIAWNQLGGFLNPYNSALSHYLNSFHLKARDPSSIAILSKELVKQAQMLSFVNTYAFVTWSFLCMLPLLIFLRPPSRPQNAPSSEAIECTEV